VNYLRTETLVQLRRHVAAGKDVLYRRDNHLVRVVRTRVHTYNNRKMKTTALDTMDVAKLMGTLDSLADYGEIQKNGTVRYGGIPERTCRILLGDANISARAIPPLDYLITAPRFAPDGTLIITPGYHAEYATLHVPPPGLLKLINQIPSQPSDAEVRAAVNFLFGEWVCDFPFVSQAGRAYFLSLLLLPLVRLMISGPTPLHVLEAPVMGTGKSLLASLVAIPYLGIPTPLTFLDSTQDDAEWRKKITSKVMAGAQFFLIDNWVGELRSSALDSAITAPLTWEDRRMGSNDETSLMNAPIQCAWILTSNNAQIEGDTNRRTVRIELNANTPEPYKRQIKYKHEHILQWSMLPRVRARLLRECLIIVQHWIAQGKPLYTGLPLGSYESWSRVLGGILDAAQVPGFNPAQEIRVSTEASRWRPFIISWHNQITTATAGRDFSLSTILEYLLEFTKDDPERQAIFADVLEGKSTSTDARLHRLARRLEQLRGMTFEVGGKYVQIEVERQQGTRRFKLKILS
jgi:hypothetical protein